MSAEARCPIPALTVGDFRCRLVLRDNIRLRGLGDEQRQTSARAPGNKSEAAALTLLRSNSTGSPFWEEVSLAMVTGLQLGLGECVWCYRLVSGPGSPHKYDDPLHC